MWTRSLLCRSLKPAINSNPRRVSSIFHGIVSNARAMTSTTIHEPNVNQETRRFPLRKPPGHRPPIPRWMLRFPTNVTHLYTLYIGVQSHSSSSNEPNQAEKAVQQWIDESGAVVDTLRITHGFDVVHSKVWVAYWTDGDTYSAALKKLDLLRIWNDQTSKQNIGIWTEYFTTPIERFEGNYAKLEHKPGASQLPGISQPPHELTAYWGAARDRVPESANDLFPPPDDITAPPHPVPKGIGQRISGTNYDNMAHIRSGQWWALAPADEREAYENNLQRRLMEGMNYLWDHPRETGTIGLRFLENIDPSTGEAQLETCGAGFQRNWADLEVWASTAPSHLAIFTGAMEHAKRFGPDRKFMTWHEVSILKEGEARMEYVNCQPVTGCIRWVQLNVEELDQR